MKRAIPGMEKLVQTMRKQVDGISELFTLDACRHGGMKELEESTDGGARPGAFRVPDAGYLCWLREAEPGPAATRNAKTLRSHDGCGERQWNQNFGMRR